MNRSVTKKRISDPSLYPCCLLRNNITSGRRKMIKGGTIVSVPTKPWTLMYRIYRDVLPDVHRELERWKAKAGNIPNDELRKQALASIRTKAFHCEGGAVYSLLANERRADVIRFIVAYQTISDYLDNLCDRSTSQDEKDFRALHEAMLHALTPGAEPSEYYRYRDDRDDGGYLAALVTTCQRVLETLPGFNDIRDAVHELASYYCDLQVYKHVETERRVPLLESWFNNYKDKYPGLTWYEFSACAGSTLGVFCFVAYAANQSLREEEVKRLIDGYFPWVQGLHILLDYFIDQEEDRVGGDLNFVFYYKDKETMVERLKHIKEKAIESIQTLPDKKFHYLINKGLLAIYLSDKKVQENEEIKKMARQFIRFGGLATLLFYWNSWMFRKA